MPISSARDNAVVAAGQQVGDEVQVIGTPWNRRAKIVRRDIPVGNAIIGLEQGPVEHPHGSRVGEVDAFLAIRIDDHEFAQFRAAFDQLRKIVTALMAVAGVQGRFFAGLGGFAGCFRCAWSCHEESIL